ncbi:MAG TPA: hypothetical protein VNT75_03255 [Symbiobacteriaceae bacterium]|nr:hypothetical protein [Symbiobacteriaceae bacterium]
MVKVAPDGSVTPFVVLEGKKTLCMTVDSADNLYVATADRVWRVTPEGQAMLLADGFQGADDLRFDRDGNLFVTGAFVARVYMPSGASVGADPPRLLGHCTFLPVRHVEVDAGLDGRLRLRPRGRPAGAAGLQNPVGL